MHDFSLEGITHFWFNSNIYTYKIPTIFTNRMNSKSANGLVKSFSLNDDKMKFVSILRKVSKREKKNRKNGGLFFNTIYKNSCDMCVKCQHTNQFNHFRLHKTTTTTTESKLI